MIFTSGATGALKLVADHFEWTYHRVDRDSEAHSVKNGRFIYLEDNHTSVIGIRAVVKDLGASWSCLTVDKCSEILDGYVNQVDSPISTDLKHLNVIDDLPVKCLFAYPAQSNFCGRKYPLSWIRAVENGALAQELPESIARNGRWFILLDAAGLVGTSTLDLSIYQPDFVCISFHKMFGFPTGLGALLVHHSAASSLCSRYFAGGTVAMSIAREDVHVFRPHLEEK